MTTPLTGDRKLRNTAVRIADLTVNSVVIEGYEFSNCRILGPAVLIASGGEMNACTFEAPGVDAVFWEVPPSRILIVGAVQVVNCVFSNCTMSGIGLAGPPHLREILAQGFRQK